MTTKMKDAAKESATAAAFTDEDGRVIVHSILNGRLGADWDLADVLALIDDEGSTVGWEPSWSGHELQVRVRVPEGWRYSFDVKSPVGVQR